MVLQEAMFQEANVDLLEYGSKIHIKDQPTTIYYSKNLSSVDTEGDLNVENGDKDDSENDVGN